MSSHNLTLEKLSGVLCDPTGKKDSWRPMLGIFQTLPNAPLPYTSFALYLFSVRNHIWEYNYVLTPISPPSKSSNLGVGLGNPLPYLCLI